MPLDINEKILTKMIPEPYEYFRNFVPKRDDFLKELEYEAKKEEIPIIGPMVGNLLYIIARSINAKNILELGTAIGYSTIFLAKACEFTNGKVITIEINEALGKRADLNFNKAELSNRIELKISNASKYMNSANMDFDLIFMDIDKEFYAEALKGCYKLLKKNGLLIVDNTAFKDADAFNKAMLNDPNWLMVNLFSFLPFHSPEQDGICIALKL
ncbi:MAG: O-methyltransferase [Desulfobacterales bacterium]|nr:O-methyltransferase [Desulfobacterales bacterium]